MCAKILRGVGDALFPLRCLGCGAYDTWLCRQCHAALPLITTQRCPYCRKHETAYGEVCFACAGRDDITYDAVVVASRYDDPIVARAIHAFKYRFARDLAVPLALLLAQSIQHTTMPSADLIVPVPLHSRRLRWRGFNQAERLAAALDLQIPIAPAILKRKRYTPPQVTMRDKQAREANVRNAFVVTNTAAVRDKTIILIDDVITTGSTLAQCATVLKQAGARRVHCMVVARH